MEGKIHDDERRKRESNRGDKEATGRDSGRKERKNQNPGDLALPRQAPMAQAPFALA